MRSCLVILIGLIVAGAAGAAVEGGQDLSGFIIGGGVIAGAFWWRLKKKKAREEILQRAFQAYKDQIADDDFTIDQVYIAPSGRAFIAIDETRAAVKLGGGDEKSQAITTRLLQAHEILGASITENGRGLVGSDLANTLGGAAIGAMVFGSAGAIVGAIAGKEAQMINVVSLMFAVDDMAAPFIGVNFLDSETPRNSDLHRKALEEAHIWLSRINLLRNRHHRKLQFTPDDHDIDSAASKN